MLCYLFEQGCFEFEDFEVSILQCCDIYWSVTLSRGENGELRVGVRRHMRQQTNMPSSVISSHSMHLGVLATASHAIATGTLFSIFYKPRTSRSEFIVSLNKYLEARKPKLSVGMRFKMRFEGEEVPERRFSGTIVGVGDNKTSAWPDSEWRSLKVQWDEPSSILRPDRVSPWELEPLVATTTTTPNSQPAPRNKRARPPVLPTPSPDLSVLGMWKSPVESQAFSYCDSQHGRDLYPSPKFSPASKANSLGFGGNSSLAAVTSNSMYWPNRAENVMESFAPVVSRELSEKRQGTGNTYRLFGIQLVGNSNIEEPSAAVTMSATMGDDRPVPSLDADSDQHSEPSNVPSVSCDAEKSCLRSPQESQSRQIRSCTKVILSLSLCKHPQHGLLILTFLAICYSEFCSMVRKIFIYTAEEMKRLSPKIKLQSNEEVKPAKPDVDTAVNTDDRSSVVGHGC
ncbi:hypothetical protein JRO89_XS02G0278400 [Xanthoceras sorbifolium]|uniref:Auxin response factor domain-containing protein n=1 Tax=Xanthoceras sorbifolium TaxID=99658 RepID=A0ABQ8IH44_9ROSI|nr:hypothetical protein JRO89_XS02G0278400 [Xanthoceras sorbifolium]